MVCFPLKRFLFDETILLILCLLLLTSCFVPTERHRCLYTSVIFLQMSEKTFEKTSYRKKSLVFNFKKIHL